MIGGTKNETNYIIDINFSSRYDHYAKLHYDPSTQKL